MRGKITLRGKMDDSRQHTIERTQELMKEVATENSLILDIGSLDGRVTKGLPYNIINIDIRKQKIRNFILGDVNDLPFRKGAFDIGIFSEVLDFIRTPQRAIQELQRTCKRIIVVSPNNTKLRQLLWFLRGKRYWRYGNADPNVFWREYSWDETKRMFEENGFRLVRGEGIGFIIGKPKCLQLERLENICPRGLSSEVLMLFERQGAF